MLIRALIEFEYHEIFFTLFQVFRYLPVFFPRRIDSMLRHWVSLDLFAARSGGESILDAFLSNFRSLWLHKWPYDHDGAWNLPQEARIGLMVKVMVNPYLTQLDEAARMDGKLVFGFHSLVPFGLEAGYQDFVQSDIFKQLGKLDASYYKVQAT